MKKKRITYCMDGVTECIVHIPIGTLSYAKIPFRGGSTVTGKSFPAEFTTDDFMLQFSIERSDDYRSGRIRAEAVIELDCELEVGGGAGKRAGGPVRTAAGGVTPGDVHDGGATDGGVDSTADVAPCAGHDVGGGEGVVDVEFSNNNDARDYLEEKYGVNRAKLRSREIIENTARGYGVEIHWV